MRRASNAPLDPYKHLGHGECDTFNRSVQFGRPTNDPTILAREAIQVLKSLKIPPSELRGIALQMGKLQRVEIMAAQQQLNFSKVVKSEGAQPLVNLPSNSSTSIDAASISLSQVDQDVFNELPSSIQQELLDATRKKDLSKSTKIEKKASPRKVRSASGQRKRSVSPTKDFDFDPSVLAVLPETIRNEVLSDARREHTLAQVAKARQIALAGEKAARENKVNRTISISPPPPKPTFQKASELPDLRDLISTWFDELLDEGPAQEDVELLGAYLQKVVSIEKDVHKATAVVNWVWWCCQEKGGLVNDEWQTAGRRLGDYVNNACRLRGMTKINFNMDPL
jgi:DNA repair protein REV1 C-terminal domain/Ubiquitin binding region